jgi:organic hydroperoxide reductase OsmC/OhrA
MHKYEAQVRWSRQDAKFTDNRYSRGHEWSFDGGVTVPASSSPTVVPLPYSVVAAVDPEEALVASVSSCHMLFFLYLAAKQGYVVEHYHDQAFGVMEKNQAGRLAFHRITLRPRIEFTGDKKPAAGELKALHHTAHEECYIANSLNCEVVVDDG